ncbi:cation:proton antiporter [Streptomyces sp. NPDC002838]|uniref:cation:proton antiporter n=1 Tax=Streptomyces sp. NPDC002838 TaxID=3154436 RepID=UPI00331CCA55
MNNQTAVFFLAVAVVLGVARLCAAGARRLNQPAVVGEIVAGIALGSTLLSNSWGSWQDAVPYDEVRPLLGALADVGLALFMFVIGYEMDRAFLRSSGKRVLGVALGAVILPLAGGCLAAMFYAREHGPSGSTGFVLFVGVAMSVTAFPVLARILADQGLNRSHIGRIAMAAAAVIDLIAWACLAVVAALFSSAQAWRVALVPVYLAVVVLVVRPVAARLLRRREKGAQDVAGTVVVVTAGLMASCAVTEWLGMHFIFGAFIFGAVMPRESDENRVRVTVMDGLEKSATQILLPIYFVVAGTRVDLTAFRASHLGSLLVMLVVAVATKMLGALVGAGLSGMPRSEALPVAVLMNTRGLTEVVILTVGLQLGLIDGYFYSVLVVMAVLTTVMTGPLLRLLHRIAPLHPQRPGSAGGSAEEKTVPRPEAGRPAIG